MRFIVDFYRFVLLASIAIMIVGLVYVGLQLASSNSPLAQSASPWMFVLGAFLIGLWVLSLGMVATFISLHDRHAEIADEIRALRQHLESRS